MYNLFNLLKIHSVLAVTKFYFCFLFIGCGSVVNNTLKSPGYPHNYPNNMYCVYSVPIPHGMAMKITLKDFYVGYYYEPCRYVSMGKTCNPSETVDIHI